eukprot:CAMPEP_0183780856 /NCGR_PEP_ID=MMETSP0739-20130205/57343_1 /TAXON_ID=385413 /ORGANISM="Thalassiosira miniscula, Strain CCMP1093" /LENGTH=162 /DNA_ID=CAMNT_0026023903 /DNA_START=200 /DNA_END=685 /DNA_ORIENTATION=-
MTGQRRPRRKVRHSAFAVHASPLSKKDSEAHSNLCQQLKTSLSLPALLRCELYCDGKGTLNIGDLILPSEFQNYHDNIIGSDSENGNELLDEKSPLGVVVAGGFSPSRGKCHGICFVGAAKLINTMKGTDNGMGMTIPQSNGRKKMMLKVMIVRDASPTGHA